VKEVVERDWKCVPVPLAGGEFLERRIYKLRVSKSGSYTGVGSTTISNRGKRYRSEYTISGILQVVPEEKKAWISYKEGEAFFQHKELDHTRLCKEQGMLFIYLDNERPGKFFLEGYLGTECDGERQFCVFREDDP
jgi:hypothetical protein